MARTVVCIKYQQDLPGLDQAPMPGDRGLYIYEHVSARAWTAWLAHQTMLINEYRLNPLEASTREFLAKEMDKFLEGEAEKPSGYNEKIADSDN